MLNCRSVKISILQLVVHLNIHQARLKTTCSMKALLTFFLISFTPYTCTIQFIAVYMMFFIQYLTSFHCSKHNNEKILLTDNHIFHYLIFYTSLINTTRECTPDLSWEYSCELKICFSVTVKRQLFVSMGLKKEKICRDWDSIPGPSLNILSSVSQRLVRYRGICVSV